MLHLKENKRHCRTFLCPHHTKEVAPPSPTVTTTYVAWSSSEIVQFCSSFYPFCSAAGRRRRQPDQKQVIMWKTLDIFIYKSMDRIVYIIFILPACCSVTYTWCSISIRTRVLHAPFFGRRTLVCCCCCCWFFFPINIAIMVVTIAVAACPVHVRGDIRFLLACIRIQWHKIATGTHERRRQIDAILSIATAVAYFCSNRSLSTHNRPLWPIFLVPLASNDF